MPVRDMENTMLTTLISFPFFLVRPVWESEDWLKAHGTKAPGKFEDGAEGDATPAIAEEEENAAEGEGMQE